MTTAGNVPAQPAPVLLAPSAPLPAPAPAPGLMSGATKTANEGEPVTFEGTFNDPGVLDTHTIRWDFGDGTESKNVLNPTHVYQDNGTYKVTLAVTDKDGDVGSATINVDVKNLPPVASLGPAKSISEGELALFSTSVTDPGANDTYSYQWDFGAGGKRLDSRGQVTQIYPDEGTFVVTVTVTDDDGGVTTARTTVNVKNEPPDVKVGPDLTVDEGSLTRFSGSFQDPGLQDSHSFRWSFGDGTVSTGSLTPSHVFKDDGNFIVTLTVTDNDGGVGTDSLNVKVLNKPPIVQISP